MFYVEETTTRFGGVLSTAKFFEERDGFYVEIHREGELLARRGPWPSVFSSEIEQFWLDQVQVDPLAVFRKAGARLLATSSADGWSVIAVQSNPARFVETGLNGLTKEQAESAIAKR